MSAPVRITGRAVADAVAQIYGLTFDELCSVNRAHRFVRPRQLAMYAIRQFCPHMSYPAIGRLLGGRDHSTVVSGVRRVETLLARGGFAKALTRLNLWFDEAHVDQQIVEAKAHLRGLKAIRSQIHQAAA